jgi:hypothetical protein
MNSHLAFRKIAAIGAVLVLALVCARIAEAQAIPAGTTIPVRIGTTLSSETSHAGEAFDCTVARDVVANGSTVVKAGTACKGSVTSVRPSGRLKTPGLIRVRLTDVGGQAVSTASVGRQGKSHTKSNATKIGGGAAAGAIIGGLAGGGKGAAIGTLAGGAAGTGVAAYTGKQPATIGAESVLSFTTTGGSTSSTRRRTAK